MDAIQRELDVAEEYILSKLIGNPNNPIISNKIKVLLSAFNINAEKTINDKLLMFEALSKGYMTNDGYYDGKKISKVLSDIIGYSDINLPNIKPIDIAILLDNLLNIGEIGKLIQNS